MQLENPMTSRDGCAAYAFTELEMALSLVCLLVKHLGTAQAENGTDKH